MTRRSTSDSRRLSWLLRHGAGASGLTMDEAGWASIADVLTVLAMEPDDLRRAVETNDKDRLQVGGDRIRACQGHSLDGMPVTHDGLEATWDRVVADHSLWHGTSVAAVEGIAARGIRPGARTHVHLAPSPAARVGKRASVDVLLEVSPTELARAGIEVFRAPNGVILVRHVPVTAIIGLRPEASVDEAILTDLGRRLGLPPKTQTAG